MEQDEIIIDGPLLARTVRRQAAGWLWKGPLLFGVFLLPALALVPRSYTASVSIAMQQPSVGGGLAGLLNGGGGGSGNKHYMGVLKSRDIALKVEHRVHLRQLYGPKELPNDTAAAALLSKSVKPEDNPDGLLYISVTLPGSPRINLSHAPAPDKIEAATAQAANAYAAALKYYFVNTDNSEGATLLRGADAQVRQAKSDYDDALDQLRSFGQSVARQNPRSAGASLHSGDAGTVSPGADSDSAAASVGLEALYSQYNQVEIDLRAAQAVRLKRLSNTAEQLRNLSSLPADDPQLGNARALVGRDQVSLETASRLYGVENPVVIRARAQLAADQRALDQQVQGVKERLTTPDSNSDQLISGLYARQSTLFEKIARAERRLGVSRNLSFEKGRLQDDLGFQREILTTTLAAAQNIKLNNASAQSRMTVIDSALPPGGGEPTSTRLALVCLLPVLLVFILSVLIDYLRSARAARATDRAGGAGGANGTAPAETSPLVQKMRTL